MRAATSTWKRCKAECDDTLAGLMLTNPNTLGLFDENVEEVIRLVHEAGGLVYGDGANLNALLGIVRPGDLGFDVMHLQPAQDLLHPARRRRPGLRPGGRCRSTWSISCPARWSGSSKKATRKAAALWLRHACQDHRAGQSPSTVISA